VFPLNWPAVGAVGGGAKDGALWGGPGKDAEVLVRGTLGCGGPVKP
jgi:hypothetical protein